MIEAVNGLDAVEKFMAHQNRIKLVISDVIMPRMSGMRAYEEMKGIKPGIKMIFNSGYTVESPQIKELIDAGFDFLSKPISPKRLLLKVREVLDK